MYLNKELYISIYLTIAILLIRTGSFDEAI